MNGSVIVLIIVGCAAYLALMSALGKFLAHGRDHSSVALGVAASESMSSELATDSRERVAS